MKRLAFFILMIIVSVHSFAQYYGEISLSVEKEKVLQYVLLKDGDDYILRLQAQHQYSKDVFFEIKTTKELIKLNYALKTLKQKFIEYTTTVKENNIKEYSKVLDLDFCKVTLLWYSTQWRSGANSKPDIYLLIKNGVTCINICKQSSCRTNHYITEQGDLFLISEEDFDTLITLTDINEIKNKLSKDIDSLFN